MKKLLYEGEINNRIDGLRKFSELVCEDRGQYGYLTREVRHYGGVSLDFHYQYNPDCMVELSAVGSDRNISLIEKKIAGSILENRFLFHRFSKIKQARME